MANALLETLKSLVGWGVSKPDLSLMRDNTNVPVPQIDLEDFEVAAALMKDPANRSVIVVEANDSVLPDEDEDKWLASGQLDRDKGTPNLYYLQMARKLAEQQPHCFRALKLYEQYICPNIGVHLEPLPEDKPTEEKTKAAKKLRDTSSRVWKKFLSANRHSWTPKEFVRRIYRDGEQFTFKKDSEWPPQLRFKDPEYIQDKDGHRGIITDPDDIADVKQYVYNYPNTNQPETHEEYSAEQIFFTKINADSTQKRGITQFKPCVETVIQYNGMVRNEVTHRNAQSSIILVKKVNGGRADVQRVVDNATTGTTAYRDNTETRERWRAGTVLTTNKNVDIEFVSPQSNFADVSPLAKLLLQQLCAATGWSYSMLTCDPSDGNFASNVAAESPVHQMVMSERELIAEELKPILEFVFESAIEAGEIEGLTKDNVWEKCDLVFDWPEIVSRDKLKDTQSNNILYMAGAISASEMARDAGKDPDKMRAEREDEQNRQMELMQGAMGGDPLQQNAGGRQTPDLASKAASMQSNAQQGQGGNQGDQKPIQHDDNQGVTQK